MRTLTWLLVLVTLITGASCSSFLDVQPKESISDAVTIYDRASAETALRGMYSALASGDYRVLNYWLRVVVRYRAGIDIIGFGFAKLLPTQLPYPSLGVLNTNFGDLTLQ